MMAGDRPPAWREAGLWALDVLARQLGEDWLTRYWEKYARLPAELIQGTYLPGAFAALLELALRLCLLEETTGMATIRQDLRRDLRGERWHHTSVQLEVAALGARAGFDVAIETRLQGRDQPVDVILNIAGTPLAVETFVVLKDQGTLGADVYMNELKARLDEICWPLGVEIDGALKTRMDPVDTKNWLGDIQGAAKRVAASRQAEVVDWPSAYVTVVPIGSVVQTSFLGPVEQAEGWPRLARRLNNKAKQAALCGASWLRLNVQDGMFQWTDWSRMDLRRRLTVLAAHLPSALEGIDSIDGMVVTSGACQVFREVVAEEAHDRHAGHALRRRLPFMRARETFIVTLRANAAAAALAWLGLYDQEPCWLDKELARTGLPAVAAMNS